MDARSEMEVELGALKENHSKMAEQLKEAVRARDSVEAGLKTTERQFEEVGKDLHYTEINLAMEKQMVTELREELRKARETAQLFKEAVEAEKQAAYALGVQETEGRPTEEFSAVARDYCDISQGKALDVTGIPADSSLRQPESIYYDTDIRELSGPNSSPLEQPAQVSDVPIADQVPPAPVEASMDSRQDARKGKEAEALLGKDKSKDKDKGKGKEKGKEKTSDTNISQPEHAVDPGVPKAQDQDFSFCNVFTFLCLLFLYHLFVKEMYHTFAINEDMFLLFHKS